MQVCKLGRRGATKETPKDTKGKESFGEDEVMFKMVKHSNASSHSLCAKSMPCLFPGLT